MSDSRTGVRYLLACASIAFVLMHSESVLFGGDVADADRAADSSPKWRASDGEKAGPVSPEARKLVSGLGGRFRHSAQLDNRKFHGVSLMDRDARVTDDDVQVLASIPNLRFFECYADRMSPDGLQHLAGARKLKVLDLWDAKFKDADLQRISQMPIERLGLYRCTGITDNSVKHFSRMSHLTHLNLYGTSISAEFLRQMPADRITSLDIRKTGIGPEDLYLLGRFRNLTYVCLPREANDASLQHLAGLEELRILPLQDSQVTGDGLKYLRTLKKLDRLLLIGLPVTDASLKELNELKQLTFLNLGFTKITTEGVANLKGLTELRDLSLYDTLVDDRALPILAALPKLKRLSLNDSRVTESGIQWLQQKRPDLKIR
jgi:Leucine-rich repeat (LRR) protein